MSESNDKRPEAGQYWRRVYRRNALGALVPANMGWIAGGKPTSSVYVVSTNPTAICYTYANPQSPPPAQADFYMTLPEFQELFTPHTQRKAHVEYSGLSLDSKLGNYGAAIWVTLPKEQRKTQSMALASVWEKLRAQYGSYIDKQTKLEGSEPTRTGKPGPGYERAKARLEARATNIMLKKLSSKYTRYRRIANSPVDKTIANFMAGRHGLRWYDSVLPAMQTVFGDDADLFLKIVAATSAGQNPKRNVEIALQAWEQIQNGLSLGGWGLESANVPNINRALHNEDLSGPKVYNFYRAMVGDANAVPVDRWMIRAILGPRAKLKISDSEYMFIEQIIKEVAHAINKNPIDVGLKDVVHYAQVQAGIWVGLRRTKPGQPDARSISEHLGPALQKAYERNPEFWQRYLDEAAGGSATKEPAAPKQEEATEAVSGEGATQPEEAEGEEADRRKVARRYGRRS